MKKLKQITLLFIVIAFITSSSCKKYPDGPLLSLHSKEHRIVGTWIVDYYSINGYDSTSYLQSQLYYGKYIFYSKKSSTPNLFLFESNIYCTSGHWKFTNNKKDLSIDQTNGCSPLPQFNTTPYTASEVNWEIRRLTDADLWLKTNYNGKEYFMKLKH